MSKLRGLYLLHDDAFERIYAAWWDRVSDRDAKARLARSVERYIEAISDN